MAATPKLESAPAAIAPEDILTAKQLAARLQVPLSWVYKHTDQSRANGNRLPVLKCGGFLRFSWPDICAWLRSRNSP